MVEMSEYIADNPQITVRVIIKAGIAGALNGNVQSKIQQLHDSTECIISEHNENNREDQEDF